MMTRLGHYIVDNCPRARNYTLSVTPTHLHFNVEGVCGCGKIGCLENASFALHKKRFSTWTSRHGFTAVKWDWHFGYLFMGESK